MRRFRFDGPPAPLYTLGMSNMRYTKISGTFLSYKDGKRLNTGVHYASQEIDLAENRILIQTHTHDKVIRSELILSGADNLDFTIASDTPSIPVIKGRFLNSEYEENIFTSALPEQNILISGSVTKLSAALFVSLKTLTDPSGKVLAVMQEQVDSLTKSEFETAIGTN